MRAIFLVVIALAPWAVFGQVPEEVGRKLDDLIEKLESQKLSKVDALPIATKYWKEFPEEERAWLALIRASGAIREKLTRLAIRKFPESRAIAEERLRDTQPAEAIDLLGELMKKPGWEEWAGERRDFITAGGHPNTDMTKAESYRQLIFSLGVHRREELARRFLSKALLKWPADQELLALEAIWLARDGSYEKAAEQYRSLKGHPFSTASVFQIAVPLAAAGRHQLALELIEQQEGLFQRGKELGPWVMEIKALALLKLGRLDEAARALETKTQPQAKATRTVLKIQIARAKKEEEKAWEIAKPWIDQLEAQRINVLFLPPPCLAAEHIDVLTWAKERSPSQRKFLEEAASNFTPPPFADGDLNAKGQKSMGLAETIRFQEAAVKKETTPERIDFAKEYLATRLAEARRYVEAAKVLAELLTQPEAMKDFSLWPHNVRQRHWIEYVRLAEVEFAFERDPMAFLAMRAELVASPPKYPPEAIKLFAEVQAKAVQSYGRTGVAVLASDLETRFPRPLELIAAGGNEADAILLIDALQQWIVGLLENQRAASAAESAFYDRWQRLAEKLTKSACPETEPTKRLAFWREWWNSNAKRVIATEMAYLDELSSDKAKPGEMATAAPKEELDSPETARLHVLRISAERDTKRVQATNAMLALLRAKPRQSEYWAGMAFMLDRESDQLADLCIRRAIELAPENEAYFFQRAEMANQVFSLDLYEELAPRLKDREAARAILIWVDLGYAPHPSLLDEQYQLDWQLPAYIDLIRANRFDDLDFLISRARLQLPTMRSQVEQIAAFAMAVKGNYEEAANHFEKSGCRLPEALRFRDGVAEFILIDYLAAMGEWNLALKCIEFGYRDVEGKKPRRLATIRMIECLALAKLGKKEAALKLFPLDEEKNAAARFVEIDALGILGEGEKLKASAAKLVEPLRPKQRGLRENYPSEVGYGPSDSIRIACASALARVANEYLDDAEKSALIAEYWRASDAMIGDRWSGGLYSRVEKNDRTATAIDLCRSRLEGSDRQSASTKRFNWSRLWHVLSRANRFAEAAQAVAKAVSEPDWNRGGDTKANAAQHWSDFIRKHELESEFAKSPLAAVETFVMVNHYRPAWEMKGTYIGYEVPTIDDLRKQCMAHSRFGAIFVSSFFEPLTYARPTRSEFIELFAELSDERDFPIALNQLRRSNESERVGGLTADETQTAREAYQQALSAALAKWSKTKPPAGASFEEELAFWNEWWEENAARILERYTPK